MFLRLMPISYLKRRLAKLEAEREEIRRQRARLQFALIGMVSVIWAKMEGNLDVINDVAFKKGGGALIEVLPKSLDRKLKFMRQCHRKLPFLAPFAEQGNLLIDQIHAVKQRRHDIIHGIAINIPTGGLIELITLSHSQDGLGFNTIEINNNGLELLLHDIFELHQLTHEHGLTVLKAVYGGSFGDGASRLSDQEAARLNGE